MSKDDWRSSPAEIEDDSIEPPEIEDDGPGICKDCREDDAGWDGLCVPCRNQREADADADRDD